MGLAKYNHELHLRYHLDENDECFYFMEHQSGGYTASPSNNKISNFKKPISAKNTSQWRWKEKAISQFIDDLKSIGLNPKDTVVIVPGATSKPRKSRDFDNRIDQVVEGFSEGNEMFRVEYLIEAKVTVVPSSHGGSRDKEDIKSNTQWNGFKGKVPETIIIVDDVLTTGSHFKAWKEIVQENAPEVKRIIGFFWALHVF